MMQRDPFRDIPHYLRIFQGYLGSRMYLVFALTLIGTLLEGVGILMVLPLLRGLDSNADAPESGAGKVVHDLLSALGWENSTVAVLLLITLAFLGRGALMFAALGFGAYLRSQLLREIKGRLFDAYTRMRYTYYAARDTGHFINVVNAQINQTLGAFQSLVRLGAHLVTTIVYLGLAFVVAWRFGLMALVLGIALLLAFRRLNVYVRHVSREAAREAGILAKLLVQSLRAFKYVAATGQAAPLRRHVNSSVGRLTGYEMRKGIATSFTTAVREPIAVVLIMLIVLVQLVLLKEPLAPILVSIVLFYRGLKATMDIQQAWQAMLNQVGGVEMVRDEFAAQRCHEEPGGERPVPPLAQGVVLRNVSFAYSPEQEDVLREVNLEIPVRTSIALVGASGAGKTTVADLITLVLRPHRGELLIDGIPTDQIHVASWRQQIGYVSQETVVFNDTIANNICMWCGNPATDAPLLERIREAARQAHIDRFIDTLQQGYHTPVGDRGLRLSGGQCQRLFIARELFRKPNLLILDEATSALDSDSERAIHESVDALKGQITVVIIAHRLSTIRNVDQVYVLDTGRVVEHGSYQQLRNAHGSYFGRLVALQNI